MEKRFRIGNIVISPEFVAKFTAVVVAGLLFLRDIGGVGISSLMVTVIVFIAFMLLDYEHVCCLTLFLVPFISGISAGRVMLLASIFLLIKSKRIKLSQIFMICFVVFMELYASRWYPDPNHAEIFPYLACSAVLFLMILIDYDINYRKCVMFYYIGIVAAIGISLIGSVASGGLTASTLVSSRGHIGGYLVSVDGARLSFNANTYAYYCIAGITCGFVLMKNTKLANMRKLIMILTYMLLFAGVFSVSRTFLLVASLCLFLYVISETDNVKRIVKFGLLILIILIAGIYIMETNSAIINAWVFRFTGEDIETGGQRVTLFQQYMDVFWSNERLQWFGAGVTQYRGVTHVYNSMHNSLQQILICFGIPGCILYLIALASPILKMRKDKIPLLYWLPFISCVIFLQSIQFLNPCMFIPTYVVCVYALRLGRDAKKNEKIYNYS